MQKISFLALSLALTLPALGAPLATKKAPTTSNKTALPLSKTITPDEVTPLANVKHTPVPDIRPNASGQYVVINIPQQRLFLFNDGVLEKVYPVAVGKAMTQTNLGEHKIGGKAYDPTWHIPKSIQAELKDGRTAVPPGPNNPLGPVFVRLGNPKLGLGIHGTNAPSSVPGVRSHGCVRMKSEQVLDFARTINTGTDALVSYEMAALNVDDGNQLWLTAFGDPYSKNTLNPNALKKAVQAWGKANKINIQTATIDRILKAKSGKAVCISCSGKGKAVIKGSLQSLAWNSGSASLTSPKSGGSRGLPADVLPESNEIEVEADSAPVVSKPVKSTAKKAATAPSNANATQSVVEQPLNPISASETENIRKKETMKEVPLLPTNPALDGSKNNTGSTPSAAKLKSKAQSYQSISAIE